MMAGIGGFGVLGLWGMGVEGGVGGGVGRCVGRLLWINWKEERKRIYFTGA